MDKQIVPKKSKESPKSVPKLTQNRSKIVPKIVSQNEKWDKFIYNYFYQFLGGQADGHLGRRRSGVAVAQVRLLHEGHR